MIIKREYEKNPMTNECLLRLWNQRLVTYNVVFISGWIYNRQSDGYKRETWTIR